VTLVPLRRNRDFVLLQVGQTLSTIGSESTAIAYPLLVLAVTGSPAQAGVVGFARIVPWALFGVAAGVLADRLNRKRVMIVADVVRLVAVSSLVAALAAGHVSVLQIVLVAFVEGSMLVFFNIAELGALRSVVPARQLPAAAAAEQARYSTVTLVAPPLGGSLFGLGRTLPFVADAVSYVCSLGSLLAMRTPFQEVREKDEAPVRAQLAEGLRWLWGHRFFRACALLFSWTNLIFEALFLVLIVASRRQGLSSAQIGALIAVFGVCSPARVGRRAEDHQARVDAHADHRQLLAATRLRGLRPEAERLRIARRRHADGVHDARGELRRDRLPNGGRSGPAHGPRRWSCPHDRALHRRVRPAVRRAPAALLVAPRDGGHLRGVHAVPVRARVAEPVDPQRPEPQRARRPA